MNSIDRKRLAVLISGSGTNLQALIDACEQASINGTIELVISNRKEAYGLQRAQKHGIPTLVMDHREFASREAFDSALLDQLQTIETDLVVLAGFMRILSPGFVDALKGKLINIHPSLLPKYRGLHTHKRAIESHDREHGASVHYVTPELDGGPIIAQSRCPIAQDETEASLASKVQQLEHTLYPTVIGWWCSERLSLIDKDRIELDGRALEPTGFEVKQIE